ncbi:MAG: peptide chain release factor N(5)-glutamine methyltransferase [Prevotella sp.]|nr:peptide chain release factor N(5)-glutamine methyltransferase [Prevotella sp.]
MTLTDLAKRLTSYYDIQEARGIVRLLLSDLYGMSLTDICVGALDRLTEEQTQQIEDAMLRLEKGEPVQYVTGKAHFCDRTFLVSPSVLIPRPETELLCQLIADNDQAVTGNGEIRVLDMGTGSGCIAITLALSMQNASVEAWDVSAEALNMAKSNAESLGASVSFEQIDILGLDENNVERCYDIIVSNPPYICNKEAAQMEHNVLDFEPHLALFVPDEAPLLFYSAIARFARLALKVGGALYFEINPLYADALCSMLSSLGFANVTIHVDQFGKQRFISAKL